MNDGAVARQVFISYASPDSDIANRVLGALEQEGISCWIAPRDMPIGAVYAIEITKWIRACHAVVLIASEHANRSRYVLREIALASDEERRICSFRIRPVQPSPELRFYLVTAHWMAGWDPPLDIRVRELASAVREVLQGISASQRRAHPDTRLFSTSGNLRYSLFAFDPSPVFLRAAKRRLLQGRHQVSVDDLVAGLVRAGHLTRQLLRQSSIDPDAMYARMARPVVIAHSKRGDGSVHPSSIDLRALVVRHRNQLSDSLAQVL